jgi:hypothetical protein
MREEIFLENLLKILNRGNWTFTGEEARVFSLVYSIIEDKYKKTKQPEVAVKKDPIKKKDK